MGRTRALLVFATALAAAYAQEPPTIDSVDSFDVEPPLQIPDGGDEPLPDIATPATDLEIAKVEKNVERAKRNAAEAKRLCKMGALSQTELEQRLLRVVCLEADLENARLASAKDELTEAEKHFAADETSKAALANAEAALARATEAARAAIARRDRAELDSAEANLLRQRKLLALGSARNSDVARAEQKLAALKAAKN
jgi:hypothetical protein